MKSQDKKISAVAYITIQASQPSIVRSSRTWVSWKKRWARRALTGPSFDARSALVVAAQTADDDVTIADVLEYGDEDEEG